MPANSDHGKVWYFAYGSNTSSRVFKFGLRRMNPSMEEKALLRGYRLAFNEAGIPFFEPAFANIEKDPAALVEGVLYRITEREMDELHYSEGGRAYSIINVEVEGILSGTVSAQVFQSKEVAHGLLPSKRYIDILIDGAEEHGLSHAWITMLKNTSHVDRTIFLRIRGLVMMIVRFTRRLGLPHPFLLWKKHRIRKTRKARRYGQLPPNSIQHNS